MKRFVWGICIVFFVLFSFAPTLYELSQKEKVNGRTFELVHNYITDYNFYLSRIREGIEGRWTVVERYTSEPHGGSLIQIFYLLLGKPVALFSDPVLGATVSYHAARIVLGALFLYVLSRVIRLVFPSLLWQVLAFFMIVTASTVPIIVHIGGNIRLGGYMPWWTVMDSLQRITFLPHLLFGQAGILFLLCVPFEQIFLKFIIAFLLGMVFPPGALFVTVVFAGMSFLEFLFAPRVFMKSGKERTVWFQTKLLPRIAVVIGCLPTFFYYSLIVTQIPWKRLVEFDALNPTVFPLLEYGYAVGPVLLFGTLGGVLSLIKKEKNMLVFVSWIITWIALLLVFRIVPQQSSLRFTEMAPNVPLGILTAYLFYFMYKRAEVMRKHGKQKRASVGNENLDASSVPNALFPSVPSLRGSEAAQNFVTSERWIAIHFLKIIALSTPIFLIVLGLGIMISSFFWQKDFVDQKISAGWPQISMNNYIVYPITGFVDALSFIEKQTPVEAIILSDLTAGNYIPPYTGRTVYVGHDNTLDKEQKMDLVHRFYQGEMSPSDAEVWLSQNRISYVFFGPEEKESKKDVAALCPFLNEVYKNNDVTVYSVFPATPN
jgi:hypothetical protein